MTFRWQSPPSGRASNFVSTSSPSPLNSRNHVQNDIPVGTVASRIYLLQNLVNTGFGRSPLQIETRPRENSRIGFGRRLTSRFAEPASRNHKPDEQTQIEETHSFLGLTTPRKTHEEEHGMADRKSTLNRSPGIHGQVQPQGITERVQYDAAAPWPALAKKPPLRDTRRQLPTQESNVLEEVEPSKSKSHNVAQTNVTPDSSLRDSPNAHQRPNKTRPSDHIGALDSEASIMTTSTIRRQSVRDLFADYGIERPARLVSSEDISHNVDDISRPTRPCRHCHACSWMNSGQSTQCWRCGHWLCTECDALSPRQTDRNQLKLDKAQKSSNFKSNLAKTEAFLREGQKNTKSQGRESSPSKTLNAEQTPNWKQSSPAAKFPSSDIQLPTPLKNSQNPPQKSKRPEQPKLLHVCSSSRVTTHIKDPPFMTADMPNQTQCIIPVAVQIPSHESQRQSRRKHRPRHHRNYGSLSSCSSSEDCESVECRITRGGPKKSGHSIKCIKKKRHIHVETEEGYVADNSHVGDNVQSQSHQSHSQTSRPHSQLSQVSRPNSRTVHTKTIDPPQDGHPSEYVECRGYPRTGHYRRGSPTSVGVVGECQHCLDDCHCAACQNTHHSVRCCVHKDHHTIAHHHHTPLKQSPASFTEHPQSLHESPPVSPAPTINTVFPPSPQRKNSSPRIIIDSPQPPTLQKSFSEKPALETIPRIHESKKEIFTEESSKAPTPPHWVSQSKTKCKSATVTRTEPIYMDRTISTVFGVDKVPNSLAPFKERLLSPLSATCKDSSPESPSVGTQATVAPTRSKDKQGHRNERQGNYTSPPKKSSVIEGKLSRLPSQGPTPRIGSISPPGSRRASRRLSALFQLRDRNAVPLLNQRLLEHQEDLRRLEKQCDEKIEAFSRGVNDKLGRKDEKIRSQDETKIQQEEKPTNAVCYKDGTVRKKNIQPNLINRKQTTTKVAIKPSEEHGLSDDEVMAEKADENKFGFRRFLKTNSVKEHRLDDDEVEKDNGSTSQITPGTWVEVSGWNEEYHECVWKRMYLDEQHYNMANKDIHERGGLEKKDSGLLGITIMLHFEGRDDVVFKGSFSTSEDCHSGTLREG